MSVVSSSPAVSGGSVPLNVPASFDLELARSKARFFQAIDSPDLPLHIVLGNQSADLDSVCTSIAKAMVLHAQNPGSDAVYLPVMNMRREELALRRDSIRVFELAGINPANLVFIDELPMLPALAKSDRLHLHLVDHNELAIGQEYLAPAVVSILDHHVPGSGVYPRLAPASRTIERCASSATLLADESLRLDSRMISPALADLLLAPIVVDTGNYSDRGPGTRRDLEVGQELYYRASSKFSGDLFDDLMTRRNDISGLSMRQLLMRDLKQYSEGGVVYAIASLPESFSWRTTDDSRHEPELAALCRDRGIQLIIGMLFGGESPADKRTLKIYSPDPDRAERLADQLMKHATLGESFTCGNPTSSVIVTLHSTLMLLRKGFQPQLEGLDFGA